MNRPFVCQIEFTSGNTERLRAREDKIWDDLGNLIEVHEIPAILSHSDRYIDYFTEVVWVSNEGEELEPWEMNEEGQEADECPAIRRIYARNVCGTMLIFAKDTVLSK